MHMADALLSPAVAGTMYACSTAVAAYSVTKIRKEDDQTKIPTMGIMGAFVFAAQMINFTIPGTGSSGHLCGGMLLSAMLGAPAGFLTMIGILLIQCLMFADGGLMALGANVWNMAFYGCFIGAMVIWRLVMKNGASKKKIMAASIIGCVVTLQLGAFSVTLETLASGITELPFIAFEIPILLIFSTNLSLSGTSSSKADINMSPAAPIPQSKYKILILVPLLYVFFLELSVISSERAGFLPPYYFALI